jgi:ParB family chromosome partitioning protein
MTTEKTTEQPPKAATPPGPTEKKEPEKKEPEKKAEKKSEKQAAKDDKNVIQVPIDDVNLEKGANPRQTFDRERLTNLAQSMKHVGMMNPLTVRLKDGKYYLVAGERRYKAAKIAGFKTVPVVVKPYTDGQATYARFTENAQQERLNPIEFAQSLQGMIGQTIERPASEGKPAKPETVNAKIAAEIANISQAAVSQYLALLALPKPIQEDLRAGKVTFAQARIICGAKEHDEQMKLYNKIKSGETKRASDVKEAAEKSRAKKATKSDGKRRGRPPQTDAEKPSIRQGLDEALERLRQVKIEVRANKELREGLATAYERFDRSKSDDKKLFYRGVIAAMEWNAGLRENF